MRKKDFNMVLYFEHEVGNFCKTHIKREFKNVNCLKGVQASDDMSEKEWKKRAEINLAFFIFLNQEDNLGVRITDMENHRCILFNDIEGHFGVVENKMEKEFKGITEFSYSFIGEEKKKANEYLKKLKEDLVGKRGYDILSETDTRFELVKKDGRGLYKEIHTLAD